MKKIIAIILASALVFASYANSKVLTINGKAQEVKPYGWANEETKNDKVLYHVSVGNVVWSIIGIENVIMPVVLTGWFLYEPAEVIGE